MAQSSQTKAENQNSIQTYPLASRVFVNRSLYLGNVKYFGFDLDYTLAEYISPKYEQLGFELVKERLIQCGYPEKLNEYSYDEQFPIRGQIFDKELGNLLKVDTFGNILLCYHGFRKLSSNEILQFYPNKFIQVGNERFYIFNTLFNLPEIYLQACIIDLFQNDSNCIKKQTGVHFGDITISYSTTHTDIRNAVDYIHNQGDLKHKTEVNLSNFVKKESKLPLLLKKLSENSKIFLVTNSNYSYTNKVMNYLLDSPNSTPPYTWTTYFHVVIVDARKPLFFGEGTPLREVDITTGRPHMGHYTGRLKVGGVYSGGSSDHLTDLIGSEGDDILYIGDHIFGDILKSKRRGWKTFLVIPELRNIPKIRNENSRRSSASCSSLQSIFRCGFKQTFFSSQVTRYADLYSSSVINLLQYSLNHHFQAPPTLMPHERSNYDEDIIVEN